MTHFPRKLSANFRWMPVWLPLLFALGSHVAAADDLLDVVREGSVDELRALLDAGADPNRILPDGSVPLLWAIERQAAEKVQLLLLHGATPNRHPASTTPHTPLFTACESGDAAVLTLLLDAGVDVNEAGPEGIPALGPCAAAAPIAVIERMVETAGADVHAAGWRGQAPLMWASHGDRGDVVRYLLDVGAERDRITATGFNALFFSITSGGSDALTVLLDAGADGDYRGPEGTSALQLALYQHNFTAAERLLPHAGPTDLERVDRNGRRALHVAAAEGAVKLVRQLLERGASPNALTERSRTHWRFESNFKTGDYEFPRLPPLLLAARGGHAAAVAALAAAGADPAFVSTDGEDVLLAAALGADSATMREALAVARDVNIQNSRGQTPLHVVMKSAEGGAIVKLAQQLIAHGAATDLADAAGSTPIDLARAEGFRMRARMLTLLEAKGRTAL